jgi:hypothetical protein
MDVELLVRSKVHQEALSFCRYPTVVPLPLWSTNNTDAAVYSCELLSAILLRFGSDIPPFQDLSLIRNTSLRFPLIITSFTVSMDLISGPFLKPIRSWILPVKAYPIASCPSTLCLSALEHCCSISSAELVVGFSITLSQDYRTRQDWWGGLVSRDSTPEKEESEKRQKIFLRKTAKLLPGEWSRQVLESARICGPFLSTSRSASKGRAGWAGGSCLATLRSKLLVMKFWG